MIFLAYVSLFSILLPSGMVFFTWNKLSHSLKIICGFILLTLILEFTAERLNAFGINNFVILHLFTFGECIFLMLYFRSLSQNKVYRNIALIVLVMFLLFSISSAVLWGSFKVHPSTVRSIECILQMVMCLFFFADLFQKSEVKNLIYYPHYWMVSGFLLYFSGTFFMNIVGDIAVMTNQLGFNGYVIHSILNIFLNIIYTIVLWLGSKESISVR